MTGRIKLMGGSY